MDKSAHLEEKLSCECGLLLSGKFVLFEIWQLDAKFSIFCTMLFEMLTLYFKSSDKQTFNKWFLAL